MVTPTTGSPVSIVGATGDNRIDALLKGVKWGGPAGTSFDVTYSFPKASGNVFSTSEAGGYGPKSGTGEPWDSDVGFLNSVQQQYFAGAMDAWSEVANISAAEVPDNGSVVGDIRVAFSGRVADGDASAWAYYPFQGPVGGDVWLNPSIASYDNPAPGTNGYYNYVHEIGHALGLSHPFGGGKAVLSATEDSHKYTVMSYSAYIGVSDDVRTPMLYDILAIQHLYGANTATRAGDTTYAFPADNESFMTVWDAGGVDTFDASKQSLAANISLNAGTFSSIGPKTFGGAAVENVAIAFGVTIENATGGGGNDVIIGNAANNVLRGAGGADTLEGGAGDDNIDGGGGADRVVFSNDLDAYSFVFHSDASTTVFFSGSGPWNDGSDRINNVEQFAFADVTKTRDQLVELFGSEPGDGASEFWSFSDFSDVSGLAFNGDAARVGGVLRLTPETGFQVGSAFLDSSLTINVDTSFQSVFTFRLHGGDGAAGADGIAFVLQSSPEGVGALGKQGGSLGFDNNHPGPEGTPITDSLAIEFDTFRGTGDPDANHVGLVVNGDATTHLDFGSPGFDLNGGAPITAWVDYDGESNLLEVFVSSTGNKPGESLFSESFDLTSVLGDSAYAGFSGATGGRVNTQDIESWSLEISDAPFDSLGAIAASVSMAFTDFTNVSDLTLNGDAEQAGDILRLTPLANGQAGSAFLKTAFQVFDDTSFETEFTFKLHGGNGSAGADGIALVLQSSADGAGALGASGGGLGYAGNQSSVNGLAISDSLAIEFDTYRGPGDPNANHVGLIINGDVSTHLDFASAGFDLNGGASITAWIEYHGTSDLLEVFVSDTGTKSGQALLSENIDMASILGARAYAGFTGGTGARVNVQDIESWTFEAGDSDLFS